MRKNDGRYITETNEQASSTTARRWDKRASEAVPRLKTENSVETDHGVERGIEYGVTVKRINDEPY